MTNRVHHYQPNLIFSAGTQVVTLKNVVGQNGRKLHPRGAVGVVVKAPSDLDHSYRIRFPDGVEEAIKSSELTTRAKFKEGAIGDTSVTAKGSEMFERVIFQCIIGSQAYGLADDASEIDRRGFYLPPADLHWSLYGVPEQLECYETQESYWEIQKFIVLALKANPNVLECLYSPIVETATPLAEELLSMKEAFLSKLVFQTYSGYVASQFKKMQTDIRNQGRVKWKHVMHLIRLLISGTHVLTEGRVSVDVGEHRERLLVLKSGNMPFAEADAWRKDIQKQFESAFEQTSLPDRPNYELANQFLIRARRKAITSELP